MPFGRYEEGRGMHEDYLQPEQGNMGAFVAGAAMLAMFYTPLGGKIINTKGRAGKAAFRGAKWAAPHVGRFGLKSAKKFLLDTRGPGGELIKRSTLARTAIGTGKALEYIGKPISWASNNPRAAVAIGVGSAALFGGMKGMRATPPQGETFTEEIMFDPSTRRGLAPDHLGATGDLTLALHGRR